MLPGTTVPPLQVHTLKAGEGALVVGFSLDPASRVPADVVFAHFVVDEDGETERHRNQPPGEAATQRHDVTHRM